MPETNDLLMERALAALELARAAGAAQVGVSAWQGRNVEYSLRDGILEKVQEDVSRAVHLKLFVDGRYSTHSTSDLRPTSLKGFVDEAVAMTRVLAPNPDRMLPDAALYPTGAGPDLALADPGVASLGREERMARLKAMETVLSGQEDVISWTAGMSSSEHWNAVVNTAGLSETQHNTRASCGAEVTLQDPSGARPEDWFWAGHRHLAHLPAAEGMARKCLALARSRVGSAKGPTVKTLMVVDPRAAGSLVSRLLGPANARSIHQGRSFWADSIGEKRFSEALTLIDDPLIKGGHGSRHWDGEGLAARPLPIVEQGVVKNLYVDTYYGRKLGMAPTTGSRSNLRWATGNRDLAAILADAPDAIYVTSWLGGNADGTTGDFSFGLRGHRITGGQLGPPIGEMNVTGNLVDLFAALIEVGNDPYAYSSTYSPTLVFDGVQFSGA